MKSQREIGLFLPLLAILVTGMGEPAGQTATVQDSILNAVTPEMQLFAQVQRPGENGEPRPLEPDRRSADQRRAERVRIVKMTVLAEYLELSREQRNAFIPRATEHELQMDTNMLEQRQLYEAFQRKIRDGEINAEDVEQYISEKTRLEIAHIDLQNSYLQGLKDLLSDEQLAKLAVFDEYFIYRIGEDFRREQP